jgi:primosomal protein N' (replication factor Y)
VAPFGHRVLTGVITSLSDETGLSPEKLKTIRALPDENPVLAEPLMETLLWASRYYVAPPGPMLALALPPGSRRGAPPVAPAVERFVRLRVPLDEALAASGRAPKQRAVIEFLSVHEGEGSSAEIRRSLGDCGTAISALRKKSVVEIQERKIDRPVEHLEPEALKGPISLTEEQAEAVRQVTETMSQGKSKGFLLVGPTGSGKTEVYLSAMDDALRQGKSAVYMVPEIALTPILARTLNARFGDQFALLHSSLTPAQRRSEWERVRSGEARVALGPRSALLAPMQNLGLIVVDEEQDGSFKQDSEPRYNARDLALVRAQKENAVALLGSATPSLESYRLCERGKLSKLVLSQRIHSRPVAEVELVDMKVEAAETGGDDPISRKLRDELRECLARKEQAIVFLNRRGWAPSLLCRKCGETLQCERCTIALTYHKKDNRLICHYCGYQRGLPGQCPSCADPKMLLTGIGTERLAEEIAAIFPGARISRLDRDVARGRSAAGEILARFEKGECDILVGTQLVAKGHDFPNVTLVGVVGADFSLGFPDFRAAERTFQILTQVAGRAGRGERPGKVVVQAYRPDHYAIQAAAAQDYESFYAKESRFRRLMGYPPYSALANITATGSTLETAHNRALVAAKVLREVGEGKIKVTGPAIAPLARVKSRYRFQIMVRAGSRRLLSDILNLAIEKIEKGPTGGKSLIIDVDPASLL